MSGRRQRELAPGAVVRRSGEPGPVGLVLELQEGESLSEGTVLVRWAEGIIHVHDAGELELVPAAEVPPAPGRAWRFTGEEG